MKKNKIVDSLEVYFPNPKCELNFTNDYELVLSVMLSAQSTDERVNLVMRPIYEKYKTLEELNSLSISEITNLISSIGLYRTKAKYFKMITSELIKYDKVPKDRAILESIPGLGRKSANVILSVLYGENLIAVDTHVTRVSKRLKIASMDDDVLTIEKKLYKFFDGFEYKRIGEQLLLFGRYVCLSKKPKCSECLLYNECNSKDKIKKE